MKPDAAAIVAVLALVLIATALVGAGLYTLFGKPSTHDGKQRKQHIVNGFQLGGGILLGIILMGSLVACSQIAFGIVESGRLSRIAAFFIAVTALVLIFSMIRHWAKHFAGWLLYSVLNGLLMISTGHLVNNSTIHVPRWWSISATVMILTGGVVSARFAKHYVLNAVDKAALMTWLLAFVFAVDVGSPQTFYHEPLGLGAMFLGTLALVAASRYHRATRHHHHVSIAPTARSALRGHS